MKFVAAGFVLLASAIAAPLEERAAEGQNGYPLVASHGYVNDASYPGPNNHHHDGDHHHGDYHNGGDYSKDVDYRLPNHGDAHYAGYRRGGDYPVKHDGDHHSHNHNDDYHKNKGYSHNGGFPHDGGYPHNDGYPYTKGYPGNGGHRNNGYPSNGYPNNGYPNNGYPNNNGNHGYPGGNGGGSPDLCPKGLLYSIPQCCQTGILGVASLDCQAPSSIPRFGYSFQSICGSKGRKAQCCSVPLANLAVLCTDPVGS
ncbi:fungal hydrophobin domain-containing protein [Hirsutella rhossiliensis]|uniref:Fungal hydrophobin domain-containing protein n=1 Tax=Hirsutella rhossiliensis TaxID=111463 RepID=A0A9P8N347_9HYPO|nr:fungal hydrophobin domain-containing protein [Hirsutella rhossiliensis]KAH0964979.1 fungal hydrophobin domain-containing protein [Hirsutella rhossiliensis]